MSASSCSVDLPAARDETQTGVANYADAWASMQSQLATGQFDLRRVLQRPKKSGNSDEDGLNQRIFQAKVKVLIMMNANPGRCLDLCSQMESTLAAPPADVKSSGYFPSGTYLCVKIDTTWRMNFMVKHYASKGLDLVTLRKVDAQDKQGGLRAPGPIGLHRPDDEVA